MTEITHLPIDVIKLIYQSLDKYYLHKTVANLSVTCKFFRKIYSHSLEEMITKPHNLVAILNYLTEFEEIQKFLQFYRQSNAYKKFKTKKFQEMLPIEKICFALMRAPQDTIYLDVPLLKSALVIVKNSLPDNVVNVLGVIICALEYSIEIDLTLKITHQDNLEKKFKVVNKQSCFYINLSGLNLSGLNLNVRLNYIDFTRTNLSQAILSDGYFGNNWLVDADIRRIFLPIYGSLKSTNLCFILPSVLLNIAELKNITKNFWQMCISVENLHQRIELINSFISKLILDIKKLNKDNLHKVKLIDSIVDVPTSFFLKLSSDIQIAWNIFTLFPSFKMRTDYHDYHQMFARWRSELLAFREQYVDTNVLNLLAIEKEQNDRAQEKEELYYQGLRFLSI